MKPSITELLTLLEAMERGVHGNSVEEFYYLARSCLVKDESQFDRFDQIFGAHFHGIEQAIKDLSTELPDDWLRKQAELLLTEEEREKIKALGGFDQLMKALEERLNDQQGRHQGGSKWIGTAGTSPFGAYGYNPEGVRIGQQGSRNRRATKVWDRRDRAVAHELSMQAEMFDERGTLKAITTLVEAGAEVNAIDENGSTIVHHALDKGFNSVLQFLADRGVDLDAKYNGCLWRRDRRFILNDIARLTCQ